MNIDLTIIDSLTEKGNTNNISKSKYTPSEDRTNGNKRDNTERKEPLEKGLFHLQREINESEEIRKKALTVYQEYQNNIKLSEQLQAEIIKGIKTGENINSLFLKAVQAISLMTSDKLFYSLIEKYIDDAQSAEMSKKQQ